MAWRSVAPGPEVQVAAVQPVIDPAAVRLIRDGGAVPQFGEPCLGAGDGVEDFGQRPFSAADRAQVGTVRLGDRQRDAPGGEQLDALQPTWTRKIMPCSAIARASSDACGCVKPAGNAVEPAIGRYEWVTTIQF